MIAEQTQYSLSQTNEGVRKSKKKIIKTHNVKSALKCADIKTVKH